jgi:hypothetical protein
MIRTAMLMIALLALAPACDPGHAEPPTTPTATAPQAAPVARVVFVGQAEACDCTRARLDQGSTALAEALGDRDIPVERLEADNPEHREAVERLRALSPLMVAPGIYFLDAQGQLVGMTQGETSAEQLREILG